MIASTGRVAPSILVVDDDDSILRVVGRSLMRAGMRLRTAPTGEAALELLAREPADVVITDIRMPGMNGAQLIHHVHDSHSNTRFIVITAYPEDPAVSEAITAGASHVLRKPFHPARLVHGVQRVLDPHQKRVNDTLFKRARMLVYVDKGNVEFSLRLADAIRDCPNHGWVTDLRLIREEPAPADVLILPDRLFIHHMLDLFDVRDARERPGFVIITERGSLSGQFNHPGCAVVDSAALEARLVPALFQVIPVVQRQRLVGELNAESHIAPDAVRILQHTCNADKPPHSIAAAARELHLDRTRAIDEWMRTQLAVPCPSLSDAMDWILLWRVLLGKTPRLSFTRLARILGLPRSRIDSLAQRLAGRNPGQLLESDDWQVYCPFQVIRGFGTLPQ